MYWNKLNANEVTIYKYERATHIPKWWQPERNRIIENTLVYQRVCMCECKMKCNEIRAKHTHWAVLCVALVCSVFRFIFGQCLCIWDFLSITDCIRVCILTVLRTHSLLSLSLYLVLPLCWFRALCRFSSSSLFCIHTDTIYDGISFRFGFFFHSNFFSSSFVSLFHRYMQAPFQYFVSRFIRSVCQ